MKLLHISDPHILADPFQNQAIRNKLNHIKNTDIFKNHFLIVTGDIIDNEGVYQPGTRLPVEITDPNMWINLLAKPPLDTASHLRIAKQAFLNAYNIFLPFKGRMLCCPGNHDFGLIGNFYHRDYADAYDAAIGRHFTFHGGSWQFAGERSHNFEFLIEGNLIVNFYGLDSNLETESAQDLARGRIGRNQRIWLETQLAIPRNIFQTEVRIVLLHHHPWHFDNIFRLEDSNELLDIFKKYPVDVVLFGHKHEEKLYVPTAGIRWGAHAAGSFRYARSALEIDIDQWGNVTFWGHNLP